MRGMMVALGARLNEMNKAIWLRIVRHLDGIVTRSLLLSEAHPRTDACRIQSSRLNADSNEMTAGLTVLSKEFL